MLAIRDVMAAVSVYGTVAGRKPTKYTRWDVGCDVRGSGALPLAGLTLPLAGLVLAASSIGGASTSRVLLLLANRGRRSGV